MDNIECSPSGAWVCDLYRLSQAIAQQADPGKILQEILENIVDRFDAGTGCLTMAAMGETALTIVAGMGIPSTALGERIEFGQGVMGWVAQHREPLLLNGDLSLDPRFGSHASKRQTPRPVSAMCWPLLIEERVVGVLSLNRKPEHSPFSDADMERVELSVGMVTVIVENARLHQEQQRRMNALADANVRMVLLSEALNKFLRSELQFSGQVDMTFFFRELLDDICTIAAAEHGVLGIADGQGLIDKLVAVSGDAHVEDALNHCASLRGLLGEVCQTHRTLIFFPAQTPNMQICLPPGYPAVGCLLVVPMIVQGKCRGALTVLSKKNAPAFDESDELSLSLFASNLGMLLERIDLLNSLTHSNMELARERAEQQALISRLQEAQSQLLQSEKMASIGQLAAGVAHEINNPVGYVASNLGSLDKYIKDLFAVLGAYETAEPLLASHPEMLDAIRDIKARVDVAFLKQDIEDLVSESQEGVKRVKQIVQDLKDFSHVDEMEWQWVDLHKGLDSTLNVAHNEIKYKAEINKEYGDIPRVECLASQINQVFMNLLVNAAHAIDERGTITVRTGSAADEVWIEVQDTGKGIPAENLKRIFDPFFTTKPVGKGTGLGLSLTYGIIQKHNGRIEVDSEVGKGTRFRVWLPIQRASDEPETSSTNVGEVA